MRRKRRGARAGRRAEFRWADAGRKGGPLGARVAEGRSVCDVGVFPRGLRLGRCGRLAWVGEVRTGRGGRGGGGHQMGSVDAAWPQASTVAPPARNRMYPRICRTVSRLPSSVLRGKWGGALFRHPWVNLARAMGSAEKSPYSVDRRRVPALCALFGDVDVNAYALNLTGRSFPNRGRPDRLRRSRTKRHRATGHHF